MTDVRLIFDRGGITLQITQGETRFQKYFASELGWAKLVKMLRAAVERGDDVSRWLGNEVKHFGWFEPSADAIRLGKFQVVGLEEFLAPGFYDQTWESAGELREALAPERRAKPGPRPSGNQKRSMIISDDDWDWLSERGAADGSSAAAVIRRLIAEARARETI